MAANRSPTAEHTEDYPISTVNCPHHPLNSNPLPPPTPRCRRRSDAPSPPMVAMSPLPVPASPNHGNATTTFYDIYGTPCSAPYSSPRAMYSSGGSGVGVQGAGMEALMLPPAGITHGGYAPADAQVRVVEERNTDTTVLTNASFATRFVVAAFNLTTTHFASFARRSSTTTTTSPCPPP